MAPVSRLVHLAGLSLYSLCNSIVQTIIVLFGLMLFTDINLTGANLFGVMIVLLVSTLAFVGLGLMAAALPVMSPARGAEATHIFQGLLLLVSGVYYPCTFCPIGFSRSLGCHPRLLPFACRKLVGVGNPASTPEHLAGAGLAMVTTELIILALMGVLLIPLGSGSSDG